MSDHLKKFDFSGYQPAFDDADQLGLQGETGRPQGPGHVRAMELIDYWVNKASGQLWPHLDKEKVRLGLIERVVNPDRIDQNKTNMCGVATFVRDLAYDDPVQYGLFGALLYEGGWGNLGRRGLTRVEPRLTTRLEKVPVNSSGTEMNHADWLVLASVRDHFNAFAYQNDVFEAVRGMTVDSMPQFFRTAGYDNITHDFSGTSTKGISNIERASDLFRQGFAVALLVHSTILDQSTRFLPTANHWVGLRSPIFVNRIWKPGEAGVRIEKIWSWAKEQSIPEQSSGFVSLQHFVNHYYGYVAGKAHVNVR